MRIARYNAVREPVSRARTGAIVADGVIGDLRPGYAKYLLEEAGDSQGREIAALRIPADVRYILHVGEPALSALETSAQWLSRVHAREPAARGVDGEALFTPVAQARLHNPLKPSRIIVVEGGPAGDAAPTFVDWPSACVMGPVRDLPLPASVKTLSFRAGLGVVIGRACRGIAEATAPGCVAGYTVANAVEGTGDIPYRRCIIGPCLVTPEDVREVAALRSATRVNGVASALAAASKWPLARLVSKLSAYGLEPGDVIVAVESAQAGAQLRAGDVLETEIEGFGIMRNAVVAESGDAWKPRERTTSDIGG